MADEPTRPGATRTTRIPADIGEKLEDLLEVLGMTSSEYLSPVIRAQVEADHKAHAKTINALRRSREAVRKARADAPVLSNELED